MRVAIVTQEFPPETNWGGIGNFSHALAHALVAEGVDVDVVSAVQDQLPTVTDDHGVTVYRSGLPDARAIRSRLRCRFPITDGRLITARGARLGLAALAHPPDVVEAPEWMAESLLLSRRRHPILVHLHSPMAVLGARRGLKRTLDLRIATNLELLAARRASMITAPTRQALMVDHQQPWLPVGRVRSSAMPLDERALHAPTPPVDKEPIVAMVGRLDTLKAPEVLLDALALLAPRITGLRAVFAGSAHPDESPAGTPYDTWVVERAKALGLHVEVLGPLPKEEVIGLFRRARVLAVPSRFETFSMVAAEAMACGTPAVVTDACGIAEWIQDAEPQAVVPTDDPTALANALAPALESADHAHVWGDRVSRLIRERCSASAVARERIGFYRELLDARRTD